MQDSQVPTARLCFFLSKSNIAVGEDITEHSGGQLLKHLATVPCLLPVRLVCARLCVCAGWCAPPNVRAPGSSAQRRSVSGATTTASSDAGELALGSSLLQDRLFGTTTSEYEFQLCAQGSAIIMYGKPHAPMIEPSHLTMCSQLSLWPFCYRHLHRCGVPLHLAQG